MSIQEVLNLLILKPDDVADADEADLASLTPLTNSEHGNPKKFGEFFLRP